MIWAFYTLATLALWQGLVSVIGGVRYLRFVRDELAKIPEDYTPFASVIVPCRGVDQGLAENLTSLWKQDYEAYEIIFVLDDATDPALSVVHQLQTLYGNIPSSRIIVAGHASDCGQKVHNLLSGVRAANEKSEVFVFVDTDARAHESWLRALVAPLADISTGAATGYRWFIPSRGGAASHLRSVWNASIASALGGNRRGNFCWGGSTAIRRQTFEGLNMLEEWHGTLSDDFALTNVLQRAKLGIHFAPRCLVVSTDDCTFSQLFEFTTRQMKITRIYAPRLWKIVLWSNLFFTLAFFGGVLLIVTRAWSGVTYAAPLAFILLMFTLGMTKAALRLRAVNLSLQLNRTSTTGSAITVFAQLFLWPPASALYLYNAIAAAFSNRIEWRGIVYELKSRRETAIISRVGESHSNSKAGSVPAESGRVNRTT